MVLHSIRWRLQIWHGLILVAVLAGFGLTAYHVARENQLRRIDQELDQRLMAVFRPRPRSPMAPGQAWPERPPGPPPDMRSPESSQPRGQPPDMLARVREMIQQAGSLEPNQTNAFYYVLWLQDGSMAAHSAGTPTGLTRPEPTTLVPGSDARFTPGSGGRPFGPEPGRPGPIVGRTRGHFREVARLGPFGDCILVGRSIAPDLVAMRRLAIWLGAAGAGILLLGLAGGWWLAARAIRPIEDISTTALKIAAGDLSQRINAADTESELGRLASVLNSTFARLEAAFAHQARFTADASHELRTPVSVILTQTQTTLSRERSGQEYREALAACQRAAQRMRKLTESLLELARLDAGQAPLKRDRFDLARVAAESLEMVRPLATDRGLKVHSEMAPVECPGDPERISQVVTNLLSNAIYFNREGGYVHLGVRAENGSAVLYVADSGQGIPAEDMPHIFERFYRVDKSRSHPQGRTGLGLAICKAIVDAHSGTIEVANRPGAGAVFTVKLPLH